MSKPEDSSGKPLPYYGYYYRILKSQGPDAPGGAYDYVVRGKMIGGFALVAYPANWGNSGVMTFMVNHDGVVYQKDLGPDTAARVDAMRQFNPDHTWERMTCDIGTGLVRPQGKPCKVSESTDLAGSKEAQSMIDSMWLGVDSRRGTTVPSIRQRRHGWIDRPGSLVWERASNAVRTIASTVQNHGPLSGADASASESGGLRCIDTFVFQQMDSSETRGILRALSPDQRSRDWTGLGADVWRRKPHARRPIRALYLRRRGEALSVFARAIRRPLPRCGCVTSVTAGLAVDCAAELAQRRLAGWLR